MTASAVSFRSFLKANPDVRGSLNSGITAAMISGHVILIGFMTFAIQKYLEGIQNAVFPGKDILYYFNRIHLSAYFARIFRGLFGLYKCYKEYKKTHKLFKVSRCEETITREAIEAKGSKKDIVVVMEGQNAESVLVWNNYS